MTRYKKKIDKQNGANKATGNQYEERATHLDEDESPIKSRPQRRPSVQKKLDMAFAEAKAEKQRLTVVTCNQDMR